MFKWLKASWQKHREDRNLAKEIDPRSLCDLSREVRALAGAIDRFWFDEPIFRDRLRLLEKEMEMLEEMIRRPDFRKVPLEKRIQLRDSLIESREHLLATVKEAPTASNLPQ